MRQEASSASTVVRHLQDPVKYLSSNKLVRVNPSSTINHINNLITRYPAHKGHNHSNNTRINRRGTRNIIPTNNRDQPIRPAAGRISWTASLTG